MRAKTILLLLAAVVCLAASYRFTSHGIAGHDNLCIGFGSVAFAVAMLLLWFAFRTRRPNRV